jgi:hypothetical protein
MDVPEPKDTTKIGFLEALKNVRIFKKDMQVVCDSLVYSDLDSLARLFNEPIIWQEQRRQYSADSITVVIGDGKMEMASLMSNAFVIIQEDAKLFDQIKGTEMLAFFDENGGLERFDVLGGASAVFFIEEKDALATVNKAESKMLSAIFKDGEIQKVHYYEDPKNDAYPIVQLLDQDKQLKGFTWSPEKRPVDRNAVTPLSLRPSERIGYTARPKTTFKETDIYFPGYMSDVYRQIHVRDSLRKVREAEKRLEEQRKAEQLRLDSLAVKDSLMKLKAKPVLADSLKLKKDSLTVKDSLAVTDTIVAPKKPLTKEEIKAAKKAAEAEKKRKAQEEKEARWAELDRLDAEKAKKKAEEELARERKRKRKSLEKAAKEARKEHDLLEYYIEYYQNLKDQGK